MIPRCRFPLPAILVPACLLAACGGGEADSPVTRTAAASTAVAIPAGATVPAAGDVVAAPPLPVDATAAETEFVRLATTGTPLVAGTINARPAWPKWWGNGQPVAGVDCLKGAQHHHHALISIYSNGQRLGFPEGIGRVHAGCYHAYEMHVHDVTGIIHMETDVPKQFTLGQWFALWGQPLGREGVAGLAGPVRFYVIDREVLTRYDGNPADIAMLPHREVLIVTGSPLPVAPRYLWPAGI